MNRFNVFLMTSALFTGFSVSATIVEFNTTQGSFQVNLFDQTTPKTVENFLRYVNEQSYHESTIHRSIPNFVVQGGGYKYDGVIPLTRIETSPMIENEPKWSNVRGTIAMAKLQNNANSATSQWYFNLKNNSESLDAENGGYTVFGQVIGDQGMSIVDKIAELNRCGEVPVVNYTQEQCTDANIEPDSSNLVTVTSIAVIDSDPTTADNLTPVENTLVKQPPVTVPNNQEPSSSGSLLWSIFVMMFGIFSRRFIPTK